MQITENCIINGMPEQEYHNDPTPALEGFVDSSSLSSTTLRVLIESTEIEAKLSINRLDPQNEEEESSESVNFGSLAHDYILLGGTKPIYEIVPFKDFRTNDAKARKADLITRGIIPLTDNEKTSGLIDSIKTMKERLHEQIEENRDWRGIMQKGMPEQSAFAFDGEIWNRARFDWLDETHENLIVDYKTTGLSFETWEKQQLWGASYLQDPHYRKVLDIINGKDAKPARFIYVVQQTFEPFLMQIFEISESYYEMVGQRYESGRLRFINCLKTGVWRGTPPYAVKSTPPVWVQNKWELDELNQEIIARRQQSEAEAEIESFNQMTA